MQRNAQRPDPNPSPLFMKTLIRFVIGCCFIPSLPMVSGAGEIIISEIMYNPAGTKAEWVEVTNLTTNRRDAALWRLSGGANLTLPDFNSGSPSAHFIKEHERILFSSKSPADTRADYPGIPGSVRVFGPWTGALNNAGESLRMVDKNGATLCSVTYGDSGRKWPAAPDGTGHSLTVVNENRSIDDWRNWTSSAGQGGTPGKATVVASEEPAIDPTATLPNASYVQAVPMNATWNFYKETAAPPGNWNTLGFTPAAPWGSGPALLGFETAGLPSPGLQTAVQTANLLTYYFRTTFNWTGGTGGAQFQIDAILDDGATYYLNGTYIGNKDGVTAVVHNASLATATIGDATTVSNAVTGAIPAGVLVNGTNVLAAVALQINSTSSDMVFGSNLRLANAPPADVLINEVLQAGAGSGFIEFYNPGASPVNLNGYHLSDASGNWTKFPITQSLTVPAGGLATLGFAEMGFSPTAITTSIYVARPDGVPFTGIAAALPQDGRSLGRKPVGGATWFRFSTPTPGSPNNSAPVVSGETALPLLNEVHYASPSGNVDWVEFTNTASSAVTLDGYFVASQKDFSDKVALTGSLAAGAFSSVGVNFPTDNDGRVILYVIDSGNNVVDEAEVRRRAGRTSSQAWPAGAHEWYASAGATQNAVNVPDRQADIVISEIMYAPPSDHRQGEYVELYNRGAAPVNAGGWKFDSGIDCTIPNGTTIAPGGWLVVAQDPAFVTANYPAASLVVGGYLGSLSNAQDLLRLEDAAGNLVDEVDYHSGGDWPRSADSLGSSLELVHPSMNNDSGSAWAASNESAKGAWTTFTYTGTWQDAQSGSGTVAERREIHFMLVGDSHLVLRNLTFGPASGSQTALSTAISPANSGADGWRVTGTHYATFSDAEGLHVVADGAGDMKGNAIELDVPNLTAAGGSYSISFEARWVSGANRLVLCTWDRSWGRTFAVPVPNNLGTPGAVNSVAAVAARPEIWNMLHSPPVPKATDDVKVTARISSALALGSVSVVHRLDTIAGNSSWTTTAMNDSGTGGDARGGDGVYTATISSYKSEGTIVQFYIQAAASGGGTATYPPGGAAMPGHWIVSSTPVTSDLLVKRFIVAQKDHNSMGPNGATATFNYRHPRMSNHYYNATQINNEKEIIYNVELRKSGSPFTRLGDNSMDRIRTKFPKDRLFRGREKTGADNDAADNGARRWNNRVNHYWLYLLNYPAAETEFIHVKFNNLGLSLKDDTEPTDTDMLDRTYGDSGATELHEVDDAWYFGDNLSSENRSNIDGNWVVTTANIESPVYWHGSWPIRTQAERYDYAPLISWIRACYNNGIAPVNGSAEDATFRASLERQFDIDKFARYAAIKAWAGAWDNFTINRGKNGYVYRRPTDGRWEFQYWDGDLDFQGGQEGLAVLGGIQGTNPLFTRPWFRRQLSYYLQEIRDLWSSGSARMNAWLQAMEDQSPSYTIDQTHYHNWFVNRRPSIDSFIGASNQSAAFTATASVGATTALHFTDLSGTARSSVHSVTVDGHPEGVLVWLTQNTWKLSGIFLRQGGNLLTVRAWDRLGNAIASTTVSVSKTSDAPPVLHIASDPDSLHAVIGGPVLVDSAASFDPEGTALNLSWVVSPAAGVVNAAAGPTGRRLVFSTAGIYTVTLSGTDGAGSPASLSREFSISTGDTFSSFGSDYALPPGLTATNTEQRDNDSAAGWYSLEDSFGRLLLQVNESAAAPLDSAGFPMITRSLPASGNWALQTEPTLDSRQLGSFDAGLLLDMVENGQPVRYVFSIVSGNQISIKRAGPGEYFYSPPTPPAPIRINCGGDEVTETDGKVWAADTGFLASPPTSTVTQAFIPSVGGSSQHYGIVGDTRRTGVAEGSIIYEIPVNAWANGYSLSLNAAVVNPTSQTISMGFSVNDAFVQNWSFTSSSTQMRQLNPSGNYQRNASGKLKLTLVRNAATTAGAQASISAIEIIPSATPPAVGLPALPPAPESFDALRIERTGNSLIFAKRDRDVWTILATQSIPAGSTASKGGIFASTESPQNLRASFDYLLLSDPGLSSPILAALRLTEVMYHPDNSGVEYLEFKNFGPDPIDLAGVTTPAPVPFTSGYTFGSEMLPPGGFIVVASDPAIFRQKYGVSPRLALTSWTSGSLSNGGEQILFQDASGNPIHDFEYDNASPWPLAPDGQGPSLEIIDPYGDYNDPLNWRASSSSDGTPGGDARLSDPDTDGDGYPDWTESAFGIPANSPGMIPHAAASKNGNGQVTVSWAFIPERTYLVESSGDLQTWQPLATVPGAGSFLDIDSAAEARRYYRVTVLPYP